MAERPNVLLILADQLRTDILTAYGGTICQTPNLDRLASESVVFERAYTPLAVCSPARASVLTGQYPHNHGVIANQSKTTNGTIKHIKDDPSLLSRRLEHLGYDRWFLGKWHLGEEDCLPRDVGLPGQQFPGHGGGGYHYPEYKAYLEKKGLQLSFADGPHPLGWHSYGTLAGPDDVETSWFIADESIAYLDSRNQNSENPFFMWVNFWGPHEPYFVPKSFLDMYEGVDIPPWPNYPDDQSQRPRMHSLKTPPEARAQGWNFWEPAVRHYFAFTTYIDYQVGRILSKLEETGQADITVVLFSADHGESIGAHNCQDKGHFMYEEIYRIPLMMRAPGVSPSKMDALVSLVDFCPTILDCAGEEEPSTGRDRRSILDLLENKGGPWREELVAEFHGLVVPYTQRMIIDQSFKYVWNMGDLDELYCLETDPHELQNMINDPDCEWIVAKLQSALHDWMLETNDDSRDYFKRHMSVSLEQ